MLRTQIINEGARVKYYSDKGKYIRQVETGALYDEAVHDTDVLCPYTYEETDLLICEDETELDPNELLDVLLGGVDT